MVIRFVLASVSQSGVRFMSHLSILPTVYTDLDRLADALRLEGFDVVIDGMLHRFDAAPAAVDLLIQIGDGFALGWTRRPDGTIEMHGDLQRISLHSGLEARLQRLARRYALLHAFSQVELSSLTSAELIVQHD